MEEPPAPPESEEIPPHPPIADKPAPELVGFAPAPAEEGWGVLPRRTVERKK